MSELIRKRQEFQRQLEQLQNGGNVRNAPGNPFAGPGIQVEEKVNHEIIIDGYEPAEANGVFRVAHMEPDSDIDRRIAEAEAELTCEESKIARRDYLHRLESGLYRKSIPREEGAKRQRRF